MSKKTDEEAFNRLAYRLHNLEMAFVAYAEMTKHLLSEVEQDDADRLISMHFKCSEPMGSFSHPEFVTDDSHIDQG